MTPEQEIASLKARVTELEAAEKLAIRGEIAAHEEADTLRAQLEAAKAGIRDVEECLIPSDGRSSWEHVEDFRKAHGHLPSASGAPCPACFRERTEARVAIVRLRQQFFPEVKP